MCYMIPEALPGRVGKSLVRHCCGREVVSCRDFILRAVATFWAMSLVEIYPGRVSYPIRDGDGSENVTFKME